MVKTTIQNLIDQYISKEGMIGNTRAFVEKIKDVLPKYIETTSKELL
jgi:hypothetical protein